MRRTTKDTGTRKTIQMEMQLPRATSARLELRELVVDAGMQAVAQILEEERTAMCGPRYAHDAKRTKVRGGYASGELVFGGRRVKAERPRVLSKDRKTEHPLASWQTFAATDPLEERAVEQMLVGVSTRKYRRSLESMPPNISERGTSKSAVSRRFVAMTEVTLKKMLAMDLRALSLLVVMLDAIEVDGHAIVVALGIDDAGMKHILGLREGTTENAAVCTALRLTHAGWPTPLFFTSS